MNPADFVQAASRIALALEQNTAGQIWDSGSPVLKHTLTREQFAQAATQRLSTQGALKNRQWRKVERLTVSQQQQRIPAGEYLSVIFVGVGANGRAIVETVSFILDPDNNWRLAGIDRK